MQHSFHLYDKWFKTRGSSCSKWTKRKEKSQRFKTESNANALRIFSKRASKLYILNGLCSRNAYKLYQQRERNKEWKTEKWNRVLAFSRSLHSELVRNIYIGIATAMERKIANTTIKVVHLVNRLQFFYCFIEFMDSITKHNSNDDDDDDNWRYWLQSMLRF